MLYYFEVQNIVKYYVFYAFTLGLKPDRVTWAKFCLGPLGQNRILKIVRFNPDLALTALLEYFNLWLTL